MLKSFFDTYKGIIFDLNGTIVLDEHNWQTAFREVFSKEIISDEPFYGVRGVRLKENIYMIANLNSLRSSINLVTYESLVRKAYFENFNDVKVTPGFFEFASAAKEKGVKLGLVTNSEPDLAEEITARLGIRNLFDFLLTPEDVGAAKPDPKIYEEAVKRLGLSKKEIIVFEDSPTGSLAAEDAGLERIIVLADELRPDQFGSKTRIFIQDFRQLNRRLDQSGDEFIESFFQ